MVLVFLRDWRSVLVVVLNIPLALLGALVALWLTGQTINLMTLGGLALAVGILVDEATVEVENIHTQMATHRRRSPWRCAAATPRRRCRGCWPCSASWPCSCRRSSWKARPATCSCRCRWPSASPWSRPTFCPARSCRCCRSGCCGITASTPPTPRRRAGGRCSTGSSDGYAWVLQTVVAVALARWCRRYLVSRRWCCSCCRRARLGTEIFPQVDAGQFQLRLRAPTGTRIEQTEEMAAKALEVIERTVGPENVAIDRRLRRHLAVQLHRSTPSTSGPAGPEEAVLRVALKHDSGIRIEELKAAAARGIAGQAGDVADASGFAKDGLRETRSPSGRRRCGCRSSRPTSSTRS